MARGRCEFVDSRLRRCPPDRASAVSYGQAGENALRFPHLAHRSAAVHKLHSAAATSRIDFDSGKGETFSRLRALAYSSRNLSKRPGPSHSFAASPRLTLPKPPSIDQRGSQDLATSLHQPVKIDAAIIVRHVDLTAVDHRRVEFVEQKLDSPIAASPKEPSAIRPPRGAPGRKRGSGH